VRGRYKHFDRLTATNTIGNVIRAEKEATAFQVVIPLRRGLTTRQSAQEDRQ